MNNEIKKIAAVGLSGLVIGLGAGVAFQGNEEPVIVKENITVVKEVPVEVPVEVVKEVVVEKEVFIDNEKLDDVLEHIYDSNGDVDYLIDDLDDDELDQIVERVAFIDEAKLLAEAEVKKEAFDELDKVAFNATVTFDEDDLEDLDIEDFDEFGVDKFDFDDKEVEVTVPFTFEQDGVDYKADAVVEIKEGEVEDFDIKNIQLD